MRLILNYVTCVSDTCMCTCSHTWTVYNNNLIQVCQLRVVGIVSYQLYKDIYNYSVWIHRHLEI